MSARRSSDNGKDAAREARRQIADHKGAWRNRLIADRRVSNAAKVVGCAIAEHINRATKEASVGVRRLAQILHMGQGPVSEAIHELVNARRIEVEWGVQGGRKVPSAFKLIVNLETPDLFSFNKYELADFIEAETEFARQNSTEFARQNSKVRRRVRQKSRASSSNKPTEFVKSAQRVRPGEQNPVLTPDNPVGTTGVNTTDDVRDSDNSTEPLASVPREPLTPMQRAEALHETVEAQNQLPPPSAAKNIGTGPNGAHAGGSGTTATPIIDTEAEFQFVRDLYPIRDDEAGARLAYCAALRESADVHQTVGLLRYAARRYAAFFSARSASEFRIKIKTLAQFIERGLWRGESTKDAIARAAAGHAGLDRHY